jgi:hypothetical protein
MYNVYVESYIHLQAHHEKCDAACVANSGTETQDITQELHDKRHPERTHSIENTLHTIKELHGEHHPLVAIRFGAEPLMASGQGRMELRFHVVGALIGFKYRIVLQEVDILVHRVIQQQEISFSLTDDSASNEITAELDIMDSTKTDSMKFRIGVWDVHEGLSDDEALVARKVATFPLLNCENALTTDNGCRLVNRANIEIPSAMREPDHEPANKPSVIVPRWR